MDGEEQDLTDTTEEDSSMRVLSENEVMMVAHQMDMRQWYDKVMAAAQELAETLTVKEVWLRFESYESPPDIDEIRVIVEEHNQPIVRDWEWLEEHDLYLPPDWLYDGDPEICYRPNERPWVKWEHLFVEE